MAATFTLNSQRYEGRYLTLTCKQTQNIAENKSIINWTLTATGGISSYYSTGATTVKINGKEVYYSPRVNWDERKFPAAEGSVSGTIEVAHNSSGAKSVSCSIATAIYYGAIETNSGTWELNDIPRAAELTSAPNFDDEDNPKITYSNPAGNAVESLRACISLDGSADDIAYRNISKTGSSYTFALTTAERNVLRNATKSSNSRKVRFYIETVIGGTTYRHNLEKTLTIVNAAPTLSPTLSDVGAVSTTLTGDSSKMIRYYNTIQVAIGAVAKKGATITSQSITCGNKSIKTATGRLSNVESNSFVFKATDSRGNTTTETITMPMFNYVPITCNVDGSISLDTVDGTKANITFTVKGNYFNGSFGATSNTLTLTYTLEDSSGGVSLETLTIPSSAFSGTTYSLTYTIPRKLDYKNSYVIQVQAEDKIKDIKSQSKTLKAVPIFDWGEDDFNFNVPVSINNNGYSYNLLGLLHALTTTYTLDCDVSLGANYINGTAAATLVGNSLRMGITMERETAVNVGNITNETVMTINVNHKGKIANLFRVDFNSGTDGGAATFDVQASNIDDETTKLTITLCGTTTAANSWNAYFVMPCTIKTKAYV